MKVTSATFALFQLAVQGMAVNENGHKVGLWAKDLARSSIECSISAKKDVDCLSFPREGSRITHTFEPKAKFNVTCKGYGPDADSYVKSPDMKSS